MKTLDAVEAAAFLGIHKDTLLSRAKAGQIPGAKVGKSWVFIDEDLADFIRSKYSHSFLSTNSCQSISKQDQKAGTQILRSPGPSELEKALGLPIKPRLSGFTMNGGPSSGTRSQ